MRVAWARGGSPALGNAKFELVLSRAPISGLSILVMGNSDKKGPGAVPLPLALGFAGMPGCFLNTNILAGFSVPTDPAGVGRLGLAVPGTPALLGSTLYGQFLVVDAKANGAGLTTTDGVKITIQ